MSASSFSRLGFVLLALAVLALASPARALSWKTFGDPQCNDVLPVSLNFPALNFTDLGGQCVAVTTSSIFAAAPILSIYYQCAFNAQGDGDVNFAATAYNTTQCAAPGVVWSAYLPRANVNTSGGPQGECIPFSVQGSDPVWTTVYGILSCGSTNVNGAHAARDITVGALVIGGALVALSAMLL